MMPVFNKKIILSASILSGTIIGAGIFSLPWVVYKAGILPSVFFAVLFCFTTIIIHIMYGDLVLADNENHRFAGITKKYLGRSGYIFTIISSILETFLILTIYLVISISFLNFVFLNLNNYYKVLIFWAIGTILTMIEIKKEAVVELASVIGISVIALSIGMIGLGWVDGKNIQLFSNNINYIFLPVGIMLFIFSGRAGTASLIYYFKKMENFSKRAIKESIVIGTLFPILIYIFFVVGIIGISGPSMITEDSVSGIVSSLPVWFIYVLGFFGIVSLLSSYISIGFDARKSMHYDLKFSKISSNVLVLFFPLALYFLGMQNFIELILITGGIFIGIEGILVLYMWKKANMKNDTKLIIKIPNYLLLIIGIVYIAVVLYVLLDIIL